MGKYRIDFFVKENGEVPAEDFIRGLDSKMKAKIFRILDILEENGPLVRMPYSEYLEDGIFEIRAKQGSDITRVLYFFCSSNRIILTNGFVKKTQKTPTRGIILAKNIAQIMIGDADYE
ncbi:MAG: type II toxin-antitoxin system RelE/ParE family toxin [Clostridiales bacterium]|nr:type II toxin-antitoxin system RelE/ParE family toxin [Clostridiales bacterium]